MELWVLPCFTGSFVPKEDTLKPSSHLTMLLPGKEIPNIVRTPTCKPEELNPMAPEFPENGGEGTITALPVELLMDIFRIHVAFNRHSRRPYEWIAITHVCRFWRDIAVHQAPDLWTRIVVLRPECVQAMLERSRDYPLSVEVGSRYWTPAVRNLIPHLPRIHSLELIGPFVRYDEFGQKSSMPVLEDLCLIGYRYAFTDAMFCSTIKFLEIRGTSDFASLRDSGEKMLAAFANMVMLESVILESTTLFFPINHHQVPPEYVTDLPHLKSIHLIEPATSCKFLLTHLSFPASTTIRLECLGDSFGPEVHSLLDIIRWRLSEPDSTGPLRTFLADIQEDTWSFYAWTSRITSIETEPQDARFNLRISTQRADRHDLAKICKGLPLDEVTVLAIHSCDVRYALALLGEGSALAQSDDSDVEEARFLHLETLILHDVTFLEAPTGLDEFGAFRKYLVERRNRRASIASLAFRFCYGITQSDISAFGDVVEDVRWEGMLATGRS